MPRYRVEVDANVVWEDTTEEYEGVLHFPEEWRDRPAIGSPRHLYVDDELIGVQQVLSEEQMQETN